MHIIGIDPGQSGGFARLSESAFGYKMPDTEADTATLLASLFTTSTTMAYIERVHAMPLQGVVSMFSFGRNYGFLRGLLIAIGIPFEEVTPQVWQKVFSLRGPENEGTVAKKNRHKAKAQQLFPELKITHATADALLIAEYGRRLRSGELASQRKP
jgi:hypothetical protein